LSLLTRARPPHGGELVRASHFVHLFSYQGSKPTSVDHPRSWWPEPSLSRTRRAGQNVGQERFELSTPRLSSVCSNQLSYWPVGLIGLSRPNSKPMIVGIDRNRLDRSRRHDSRKEVIQPQVPLRLPCYDFTPVTSHSLGGCLRGWRTDF
jgi:hypothetical protein